MARPTDEERLERMSEKIEEIKARKQRLQAKIKERERKARTRRLIQVGALFEKYLMNKGEELHPEQAEKIAFRSAQYIKENMNDYLKTDVKKSKKQGSIAYEITEEKIIIPPSPKSQYDINDQKKRKDKK